MCSVFFDGSHGCLFFYCTCRATSVCCGFLLAKACTTRNRCKLCLFFDPSVTPNGRPLPLRSSWCRCENSASPWPSIHNPGEKQPWGSTQQHYPHQQDRQQLEQHRQEGQQDEDVQGSPSQQAVGGPGQQSYSTTFLSQQQGNGWSAPRITPARPLSPQNRG